MGFDWLGAAQFASGVGEGVLEAAARRRQQLMDDARLEMERQQFRAMIDQAEWERRFAEEGRQQSLAARQQDIENQMRTITVDDPAAQGLAGAPYQIPAQDVGPYTDMQKLAIARREALGTENYQQGMLEVARENAANDRYNAELDYKAAIEDIFFGGRGGGGDSKDPLYSPEAERMREAKYQEVYSILMQKLDDPEFLASVDPRVRNTLGQLKTSMLMNPKSPKQLIGFFGKYGEALSAEIEAEVAERFGGGGASFGRRQALFDSEADAIGGGTQPTPVPGAAGQDSLPTPTTPPPVDASQKLFGRLRRE